MFYTVCDASNFYSFIFVPGRFSFLRFYNVQAHTSTGA